LSHLPALTGTEAEAVKEGSGINARGDGIFLGLSGRPRA
jgi:hypothetical protein